MLELAIEVSDERCIGSVACVLCAACCICLSTNTCSREFLAKVQHRGDRAAQVGADSEQSQFEHKAQTWATALHGKWMRQSVGVAIAKHTWQGVREVGPSGFTHSQIWFGLDVVSEMRDCSCCKRHF